MKSDFKTRELLMKQIVMMCEEMFREQLQRKLGLTYKLARNRDRTSNSPYLKRRANSAAPVKDLWLGPSRHLKKSYESVTGGPDVGRYDLWNGVGKQPASVVKKEKKEAERIKAENEDTVDPTTNPPNNKIQQPQTQAPVVLVKVKPEPQDDSMPTETIKPAIDSPNNKIQQSHLQRSRRWQI